MKPESESCSLLSFSPRMFTKKEGNSASLQNPVPFPPPPPGTPVSCEEHQLSLQHLNSQHHLCPCSKRDQPPEGREQNSQGGTEEAPEPGVSTFLVSFFTRGVGNNQGIPTAEQGNVQTVASSGVF